MSLSFVGRVAGMTIIELVTVMTIVALLVSLALPSYKKHMLRVHRTDAIVGLLELAACQERISALTGRFDTTRCLPGQQDHYTFRIEPADSSQSLQFTAWAQPIGSQAMDACGSLGINQTGLRLSTGSNVSTDKCWRGR